MLKLYFQPHTSDFLESNRQFQIAEISHVYNNPNWLFNFHSHDDLAEIIIIADGRGTYSINGTAFSAARGDLIVINPHSLHAVMSDAKKPIDSWTLTITGIQFPGLPENYILPPSGYPCCTGCADTHLIQRLLERIVSECRAEESAKHTLPVNDLIRQIGLTILLLTRKSFEAAQDTAVLPEKQSQRRDLALKILDYIDRYYREPISNTMLAQRFHVSVGHLGHLFTEEFGISPINYQISRRMSDAQWMLVQTDKSIHQISYEIGYDNPYHFTQLFTKHLGIHPKDYRKQFRNAPIDPSSK